MSYLGIEFVTMWCPKISQLLLAEAPEGDKMKNFIVQLKLYFPFSSSFSPYISTYKSL